MTEPKKKKNSLRERELVDVLRRLGGSARNTELAQAMGVSEETIRRLLKSLAKAGKVDRLHGGCTLTGYDADTGFLQRLTRNPEAKARIAKLAAKQVSDGMTVFLDVASTTAFIADSLRKKHELTIVTNSLSVPPLLSNHKGNRVYLAAGEIQKDDRGVFGAHTERFIQGFRYDVAILGADAVHPKHGFLYRNPREADLASAALEQADTGLMAVDSEKFARASVALLHRPEALDLLVTDAPPPDPITEALERWQISTLIAPSKED